MISLSGKRALVTGGSRGIGAAVARLLAEAGANVGIAYRSRSAEADAVLADITNHKCLGFSHMGDLSTKEANEEFVDKAKKLFGGVDIYVGNFGVWPPDPLPVSVLDDERWRFTMATNLDGMFYGARAAARAMSDGGRMIFVSSTAGQRGEAGHADYAASKGAMISFVKSLSVELGSRNITVNAIAPGFIDTDMTAAMTPEARSALSAGIPLERLGSAEDIASMVAVLASDLTSYVTGQVFVVDGGMVM